MVSQICLDKIATKPPPLNRPCPSICNEKNFIDGTHCKALGLNDEEPFMTQDPDFGGPGVPGFCYCCCSCFTLGTPIEVAPAQYELIENVQQGDLVLAAGLDLDWKPCRVRLQSGPLDRRIVPGLWQVRYQIPGEAGTRDLVTTPDHLFLLHGRRTLKPVQNLVPGDGLTTKDGASANVLFAVRCDNVDTAVHTLVMDGDFDGTDPSGHLVNSNGVVTADYIIQTFFERQGNAESFASLFEPGGNNLVAGSPEYVRSYPSPELQAYLNNPSSWPKGIVPIAPAETIQPPREAVGYLTSDQAADVAKNAEFHGTWIASNQAVMLRLFKEHRAYHPDTVCIIDRDGETPNAFSWYRAGQKFILFTGAFLRVKGLYREFYSLVLSVLQAHVDGTPSATDADYEAVAYHLREKYDGPHYATTVTGALEQAATLFASVSSENSGAGQIGTTELPSVGDRLQTYQGAISFRRIPNSETSGRAANRQS
ncbi:hypothetical protein ACTOB_004978 [Actinoplanes oblitus]|uniref:Hint domain-containing protein n=1 Tax=Actinoplanes oblitus TaxID=3040509 RepID=A0ABY8W9A5_9ACTN|nr:hypothetical protein [Actinoplanes oblitus]WIM93013.1 hypothetical protein ACTOB_004978 [Actinoplanes oblitus]